LRIAVLVLIKIEYVYEHYPRMPSLGITILRNVVVLFVHFAV